MGLQKQKNKGNLKFRILIGQFKYKSRKCRVICAHEEMFNYNMHKDNVKSTENTEKCFSFRHAN